MQNAFVMLVSRPLCVAAAAALFASVNGSAMAQSTVTGHGPFKSGAFGFTVALPAQFQYLAVIPGGAADGFRATLPTDASVWLNGLRTDSTTLAGVVAFIRAHRPRCAESSATPTTLGGLPATELVFMCPGGTGARTNRLVVALRPTAGLGGVQYNLGLESGTPVDSASLAAFDILRRGFRTSPLP